MRKPRNRLCFNSTLVQLKAGINEIAEATKKCFNSTLVQLKGT